MVSLENVFVKWLLTHGMWPAGFLDINHCVPIYYLEKHGNVNQLGGEEKDAQGQHGMTT
jgi:hypothetical protein